VHLVSIIGPTPKVESGITFFIVTGVSESEPQSQIFFPGRQICIAGDPAS